MEEFVRNTVVVYIYTEHNGNINVGVKLIQGFLFRAEGTLDA